jgi:hypothetical protein
LHADQRHPRARARLRIEGELICRNRKALVPSVTNWFDDPVTTVNAVGNELFGEGNGLVGSAALNARRLGIGREPIPAT